MAIFYLYRTAHACAPAVAMGSHAINLGADFTKVMSHGLYESSNECLHTESL